MGVLDGKGAVVTGGSRGIGRAIVRRLAADGASVVFSFARRPERAAGANREPRDPARPPPAPAGPPRRRPVW